ncbi:MAG: GLUG motif-containing protein [Faecousia sp.]
MKQKTIFCRILALLLIVALLFSLLPVLFAAGASETIYISTAEDFAALAQSCTLDTWSPGKNVILTADISLSGIAAPMIPTFGGSFDGNGYTISDVQLTQSATPCGLFCVLQENAVVKDLTVSGSVLPGGSNVGGIIGENYGSVIDCTFTGNVSGERNVGGVVGINGVTGQILHCSAGGSVVGKKMTGGIVGCNLGILENCQNSAYVNTVSVDPTLTPQDISFDFSMDISKLSTMDTGTAASDTGGIAGYSSGIVSDCDNRAPVGYPHIGYNVGGVVGRNCGYVHRCENDAEIFGRKDIGGIVGQMEPHIAQNVTESTLSKLERQLDELDIMLTKALEDADAGVGTVGIRLNRIADYMDSAAGAASDIRTSGAIVGTASGSAQTDSDGSITVTPPQAELNGSGALEGGAGAIVTPIGGVTGGEITYEGELQGGLTESGAEGESHSAASGNVSASTQISVTTNLSGISSAVSGMSGQIRLLNGEIAGLSGTLSEDVRAIQQQINAITDTTMELFFGDGEGDVLIDSSETDIALVTLGKVSDCTNFGSVDGDINVGGIAGAMAMEYALDPEDDITSNLDGNRRRKLEVKAILQNCTNHGSVTAKRSYAGSICGRMDLGLIARSEGYGSVSVSSGDYAGGIAGLAASTIRHCFAKCTLSGEKYIGGIVGSGVTEDIAGSSGTVAGCYSMVKIEKAEEFFGAVSGVDAGDYVENYFISDTLTGINGRSYTGKAEPISYAALLELAGTGIVLEPTQESSEASETADTEEGTASPNTSESADTQDGTEDTDVEEATEAEPPAEAAAYEAIPIPDAFLQLSLTFVADGVIVKTLPIEYGDSFDESVYPEIPEKEGYYACWDRRDLTDLHFDTVVTAIYTPYVTALSNTETRNGGRPIFFVEGQFDDEAVTNVTSLPNTPDEFDFLASNWGDFLAKSFSGKTVSRQIVEQWRVTITDDGQDTHTVRYLAPDADPENLDIYVKTSGGWHKADTEIIGSYLTFPIEGTEAEIAVISTTEVWWVWLLAGILLLVLLILLICLIRKLVKKKKRTSLEAIADEAETDDGETEETEEGAAPASAAPKKRKRWRTPLLIVLALLVGIGGTAAFFLLPELMEGLEAYDLLKQCMEKQELTMDLTVNAELDSERCDFTATVERTVVDGHQVTAISQDGRALFDCDGAVFLENGNAYKLTDAFPDYSQLLTHAMELYRHVEIDKGDGTYTITAEGTDASAVLKLLLPSAAQTLADTNRVQVEMTVAQEEVTALRFTGSGTLADAEKTPFHVSALLTLPPEAEERISIPEPVKAAIRSGDYQAAEPLSEDLLRLMDAWKTLQQEDSIAAQLLLKADCGPVALKDRFDFYRWNGKISSIQKNGYALYVSGDTICDQNGNTISAKEAETVEAARLPDIAYQLCLNAELNCSEAGGKYTYTLSLDEAGMETVAYAIAPAAEGMDILFDSGSLQIVLHDDRIERITLSCTGSVQVVLSNAAVSFEAQLDFPEDMDKAALPEGVRAKIEK